MGTTTEEPPVEETPSEKAARELREAREKYLAAQETVNDIAAAELAEKLKPFTDVTNAKSYATMLEKLDAAIAAPNAMVDASLFDSARSLRSSMQAYQRQIEQRSTVPPVVVA